MLTGSPMLPFEGAIRALALGLFDGGDGIPRERLDWVLQDLEGFLGHAGPRTRGLFVVVMAVIEWLPPLLSLNLRRLSRLGPTERAHFLERLETSRFAILLALPKAALSLTYYEHPEALAETGYDGTCLHGDNPALVQLKGGRP